MNLQETKEYYRKREADRKKDEAESVELLKAQNEELIKEHSRRYGRNRYASSSARREQINRSAKKWRQNNREQYNAILTKWRDENREKYNAYNREWMRKKRAAEKLAKGLSILLFILMLSSCKSTSKTVTRDHFVSDTIMTHTVKSIILPVKNITKIDRPCLNDSLIMSNQTIATPYARVTLREEKGSLVVEVNTDSIVNERVKTELKRLEKDTTVSKEVIIKYRLPPWMWYVLGYTVLITLYTFRRFIPILNMIP